MPKPSSTATPTTLQWSGTLLQAAQARTSIQPGTLASVPVLCFDIELDNPLHNHMHVEQPFPSYHFSEAAAAAKRLKKGTKVTVDVIPQSMFITARNVQHVHVVSTTNTPPTEPTP